MFLNPCGVRPTGWARREQENELSPMGEDVFALDFLLARLNLSREFYENVEIVLDKSQINRIISHTTNCKGYWIGWKACSFELDGAF